MFKLFRRRRPPPLPPAPPTTHMPESWVALIFCYPDAEGVFRNSVEHFESEEMAVSFMKTAPAAWRDGFKGAFREVPGFLAQLQEADVPQAPPKQPTPTQPKES